VMTNLFRPPGHRKTLPADADLARILTGVESTLDPEKRQEFVTEAQQAILERRMIVPILTNYQVTIIQAGLQNYQPDYLNQILSGDLRMSDW
jgi:peptide/nickel transport system substrate-binding protein